MKAPDPAAKLAELIARPLVKVCGLTREEDVACAAEAGADLAGFILADTPRRAPSVLPVPDTMLSVAVFVGAAEDSGADLVQLYEEETAIVAATPCSCATASGSREVVDLPWLGEGREHWQRATRAEGRVVLAGGLAPENVGAAIEAVRPWAVDAARSLEAAPGIKDHETVRAFVRAVRGGEHDAIRERAIGYFGPYGGRYVPETLVPALDELERGWREIRADPSFLAELDRLQRTYAGRPTPLTDPDRLAPGRTIYLKREDLCHTGAHKINNALGQALIALSLGKCQDRRRDGRRPARRRDRDGLRALRPRVRRLHGRRGHAPPAAERRAHVPARRRGGARSSSARRR